MIFASSVSVYFAIAFFATAGFCFASAVASDTALANAWSALGAVLMVFSVVPAARCIPGTFACAITIKRFNPESRAWMVFGAESVPAEVLPLITAVKIAGIV